MGKNIRMSNVEFVVNSIYKKAPFQKKKIKSFLDNQNSVFFQEFENFLSERKKTQYLWSTHYEMFSHLKSSLAQNKSNINKYLEIGPGHGLFLKNAIDILNKNTEMTAVDISQTSLNVSKSIIDHFYPLKDISFVNKDVLDLYMDSEFDFIVMGEVIEHVEDPELLLVKISKLLSKNGRAFLSTCVNCPAIDHVYHFHTVDEIRNMFKNCGLTIESEKVLPVEDAPMAEIVNQKITINYSAIVRRDFE
jgi:2-polyprenyl-3-methyl-5-hydroxy-6-metoxy-1,4-benzoquinol methylase